MMCEIPNNVIQIDAFARLFDGFSIGSNDLTQLTLGIDRAEDRLSAGFDENHPAVRSLIEQAVRGAHARGRPVGLCGAAPSDKPDFARWLVSVGIDSVSIEPDAVLRTIAALTETESQP